MNPTIAKYLIYYPGQFLRGEPVSKALRELEKSQWNSPEDLLNKSFEKMCLLLKYSYDHVPFYRRKMDVCGIRPEDIKTLDDWKKLPLLTKGEVQEHGRDLLSTQASSVGLIKKTTSGSTGQVVTVYKSPKAAGYARAAMYRGYRWWGIDIGDRQARFWGIPINTGMRLKYNWIDFFMNRKRISAFNFDEKDMHQYFGELKNFKPDYLYGYASMMVQFSNFLNDRGLDGRAIGAKLVITTAEALLESERQMLESTFGCKVLNEYGCGEVGPIAYECTEGGFHINAENIFIEYLETHADDLGGEVIVTELRNFSMPLIRYRLGDYAMSSNKLCECGRGLPLLKDIVGRAYDFIISPSGKRFHGEYIMYLFEDLKAKGMGIRQFQIIQLDKNLITVKLVKGMNFNHGACQYLEESLLKTLGGDIKVNFEFVDEIPREKSGKIRLIKSFLHGLV